MQNAIATSLISMGVILGVKNSQNYALMYLLDLPTPSNLPEWLRYSSVIFFLDNPLMHGIIKENKYNLFSFVLWFTNLGISENLSYDGR